jgi:sigma-B regulation protein RsbU (phosphoserine phosphatase)
VKGKGVPASLLMASARSSLRAHVKYLYDLSEVLAAVNRDILQQSDESDFVTIFYGVLDVPNLRLTYCSAGHEPALLVRDSTDRLLSSLGGVVGMFADMKYQQQVLELRPGDVLAISSDGLPEATNFNDEPFGRERSRQAVLDACRRGESADGIGRHQLWQMRRFAGLQTRCDDLTLVTIKVQ